MDIVFEMTKKMISSSSHRQVAEERHRSSRRWLGGCGGNLFVREGIPGIVNHQSRDRPINATLSAVGRTNGLRAAAEDLGASCLFDRIELSLTFMRVGDRTRPRRPPACQIRRVRRNEKQILSPFFVRN